MKKFAFLFVLVFSPLFLCSQNIEFNGGFKADSINVNSGIIKNVADPKAAHHATTKSYIDSVVASIPPLNTYAIGDFAHGGIVFWVDETGQHGLVCGKTDVSSGIRWAPGFMTKQVQKGMEYIKVR